MNAPQQPGGFLSALFDFSFSTFVTTRLVPVIYVLGLIAVGIAMLSMFFTALSTGAVSGILMLILAPLFFLFAAMYLRVMLEVMIVLFRIAENIGRIADRSA